MEEEQAEAVVPGNPPAALVVAGADAERPPDIEISTTERSFEPRPVLSVWQRYSLPVLGALADVAVRDVLPRVLDRLSVGKASAPTDESASARVTPVTGDGGHRHRHGRAGRY